MNAKSVSFSVTSNHVLFLPIGDLLWPAGGNGF
jgi:hypothetical protein